MAKEWLPLGGGVTGEVLTLAVDLMGNVYVGGRINKAGNIDVNGIAMWNGQDWQSMAGGVSGVYIPGVVNAIATDKFGFVYVGGSFTYASGLLAMNVARWDGYTWIGLGEGIMGQNTTPVSVYALATDNRGNLFAGQFDTAGGKAALNIARWNGDTWSALGAGVSAPSRSEPVVLSL